MILSTSGMPMSKDEFTEEEVARRRDAAIRRAMSKPPKPLKAYVGKSERAMEMKEAKATKAARLKTKTP